ncbi:MAG: LCP family protein [Candidatus Saccharimonadales bacterium]
MKNKSIDGLQRRPKRAVGKVPTKKTAKKIAQKPKAEAIIEQETTVTSVTPEHEEAVRDFLSSVQDSDPTDLIGLPPEKEEADLSKKERKKAAKRAKKEAEKKSPKKKHKARRTVLTILGILLVIIIGIGVWAYIQGNDFISRVTGGGNLWDTVFADPDTPLKTDPSSGRTNVLIFGTEGYSMDDPNYDGGWLTDSMMVASINQETGDIKTVSLPRDLKSKTCTSTSKLNEVYYCTYSKNNGSTESRQEYETKASEALATEVEKILGVQIQYYVHVNWQALTQIVDTIGGIDVVFTYGDQEWAGDEITIETTSKKGLADYNRYCKCYVINYPNGEVIHLDGKSALAVARARNEAGGWGASGGNFSREIFQQKIIQAVIMKAKETNFATDFFAALEIKDAVGDNVRMNFQDTELKTLLKLAGNIDINSMQSISLVNPTDHAPLLTTNCTSTNGVSYVCPTAGLTTYTNIHTYIARKFSSDPAVSENAEISMMNATTVTGLAASEGKKLEEKGFNIVETTNAPTALKSLTGYTVYQLTSSMTNTAKTLADFYDVEITTTIPDSLKNSSSDFIVIIGNGYDS